MPPSPLFPFAHPYQVASHLALEGMMDESLKLVRAVRARYDGAARNPFNEYEAGSFYARAMASYSLLAAWSGFRYSALDRTLHFAPPEECKPFGVFFSAAGGFGSIEMNKGALKVTVLEGKLAVDRVVIGRDATRTIDCAGADATPGRPLEIAANGRRQPGTSIMRRRKAR